MKLSFIYGILNSLMGFFVGLHVALTSIGNDYYVFVIAAPIAIFLVSVFLWQRIIGNDSIRNRDVIIVGLLTGSISHYLSWLLLSLGMNICYWCTGGCTDSLGNPPANILDMVSQGFLYSFFSIIAYGWITIPCSVILGFVTKLLRRKQIK